VRRAIATIGEQMWTPIHCPNASWDEDQQRLISDADRDFVTPILTC
jgi:hypothetical protein